MYNRLTNQYSWPPFGGRPFIFVPASFLNNLENGETCEKTTTEGNNDSESSLRNDDKSPVSAAVPSDGGNLSSVPQHHTCGTNPGVSGGPIRTGASDGSVGDVSDRRIIRGQQRKVKRMEAERIKKAEDVAEYKGRMPIDDLLTFINSRGATPRERNKDKKESKKETKKQKKGSEHSEERRNKVSSHSDVTPKPIERKESDDIRESDELEDDITGLASLAVDQLVHCSDSEGSTHEVATDIDYCNSHPVSEETDEFIVISRKKKSKLQRNAQSSSRSLQASPPDITSKSNASSTSSDSKFLLSPDTNRATPCQNKLSSNSVCLANINSPVTLNATMTTASVQTNSAMPTSKNLMMMTATKDLDSSSSCQKSCGNSKTSDSESRLCSHKISKSGESQPSCSSLRQRLKETCLNHRSLKKLRNEPVVFVDGQDNLKSGDIGGVSFGYETSEADRGLNGAVDKVTRLNSLNIQTGSNHLCDDVISATATTSEASCKRHDCLVEKNSLHPENTVSMVTTNLKRISGSGHVLACPPREPVLTGQVTAHPPRAPVLMVSPMQLEKPCDHQDINNNDNMMEKISTDSVAVDSRKELEHSDECDNEVNEKETCFQPMTFDLLYAQIFLHKTFTDTLSDCQNSLENFSTTEHQYLTNDDDDDI